jgi:hypothetical protein
VLHKRPGFEAQPDLRLVRKNCLFSNPATRGHVASTAIELYSWINYFWSCQGLLRFLGRLDCRCRPLPGSGSDNEAKVFPHLEAWVRGGRGIPHGKVFVSLSALSYSKE